MAFVSDTVDRNKRENIDGVCFSEYDARKIDRSPSKKLSAVRRAAIRQSTKSSASSLRKLTEECSASSDCLRDNSCTFGSQSAKLFRDCEESENKSTSEPLKLKKHLKPNGEVVKSNLKYGRGSNERRNIKKGTLTGELHKCKSVDSSSVVQCERDRQLGIIVEGNFCASSVRSLDQSKSHPLSYSIGNNSQRLKRSVSQSPNRNISKGSYEYDKENAKIRKEKWLSVSSKDEPKKSTQNPSSEKRITKRIRLWKFEESAMWVLNSNGEKRLGYLLFNCSATEEGNLGSVAEKYEMTYKFSQVDSKLIRVLMSAHGLKEATSSSSAFNVYWGNSHFSPNEIRSLQEWQKINHFPRSSELTRKDRLYMNIKRMQRQCGVKAFNFIPLSFILPTEYRDFCDTHLRERGTWIVKPVASSQGKGIYLISQVDQVPPDETALICRYLEPPLLINGFKCDLRLYVLMTSLDPLVIYLYEEGLVRFATVKYQHGKNLWNPCIHLTNYSVNKFHSDYIQNEDPEVDDKGNKWSLSAFLRYLKSEGVDTRALMCGIEDVIIKSIMSAAYQMNTATNMFIPHPRNCFELYGFDILVDSNLKPWVLEVNLSPSLNVDQPLDLKIKSAMLADLFSLVGIQVCNPRKVKTSSRPPVYRKLPNLRQSSHTFDSFNPQSHRSHSSSAEFLAPTSEELGLFRQLEAEFERKGGWARIFPTPDSWALYGSLQEYSSPLNLIFHLHLYPQMPRSSRFLRVSPLKITSASSSGLQCSLERLNCYERPLPKTFPCLRDKFGWGDKRTNKKEAVNSHLGEVKSVLVNALQNGLTLSKYQARMAFSAYLQHVQRRLMIGIDQDQHTDLVCRFLRSASRTIQSPFIVQVPSKTLPNEARAVIISKQLGDFIQAYTKDTQCFLDDAGHSDPSSSSQSLPLIRDHSVSQSSINDDDSTRPESTSAAVPFSSDSVNSSIASYNSLPSNRKSLVLDSRQVSQSDSDIPLLTSSSIPRCLLPSISHEPNGSSLQSSSMMAPNCLSSSNDRFPSTTEGKSGGLDDDEAPPDLQSHPEISADLYRTFLSNAKESELEEILDLQTRHSASVLLAPQSATRGPQSAQNRCRTPTMPSRGSPQKSSNSRKSKGSTSSTYSTLDYDSSNPKASFSGNSKAESSSEAPSTGLSDRFGDILKASLKGTKIPF